MNDGFPGRRTAMQSRRISLDWWTVIGALAAATLVKIGLIPRIPW